METIKKCRITPVIKNKNLKSVLVTKDNVKEVQKELGFFEIFNEEVLLTGFLSFQRIPILHYLD
ncbi:hypothetical protein ACVNP0_00435 [Staphylococcus aureus]